MEMEPLKIYNSLSGPITVQVEIVEACPENCPHCFNFFRRGNVCFKKMSISQADILIDELMKLEVAHVTITGGDPLKNKPVLNRFMERFFVEAPTKVTGGKIPITINSTLIGLTEKDIATFVSFGVKNVLTSLHSSVPEWHDNYVGLPGAWKTTVANIQKLMAHGVDVGVNAVVTKKNLTHIKGLGLFLPTIGIKSFFATKTCIPGGLSLEQRNNFIRDLFLSHSDFQNLLDSVKQVQEITTLQVGQLMSYPLCAVGDLQKYDFAYSTSCGAGITEAVIGVDGSVRPCSPSSNVYGNAFDPNGLLQAWENMSILRTEKNVPGECLDCKIFSLCGAGCRANMSPKVLDMHALPKIKNEVILPVFPSVSAHNGDSFIIAPIKKIRGGENIQGEPAIWYVILNTLNSGLLLEDAYNLLEALKSQSFKFEEFFDYFEGFSEEEVLVMFNDLMIRSLILKKEVGN